MQNTAAPSTSNDVGQPALRAISFTANLFGDIPAERGIRQPNPEPMNLIDKILRLRDAGHTTCAIVDVRAHESGPSAADHVVQAHGFRGIATEWDEVSATDAHAIVATLLHRDLASGDEIMPLDTAADLATQLFDFVPEPHAYFTNGEWAMNADNSGHATLSGFNPISDAALDSGVVCIGDGRAALFWVQDEE